MRFPVSYECFPPNVPLSFALPTRYNKNDNPPVFVSQIRLWGKNKKSFFVRFLFLCFWHLIVIYL